MRGKVSSELILPIDLSELVLGEATDLIVGALTGFPQPFEPSSSHMDARRALAKLYRLGFKLDEGETSESGHSYVYYIRAAYGGLIHTERVYFRHLMSLASCRLVVWAMFVIVFHDSIVELVRKRNERAMGTLPHMGGFDRGVARVPGIKESQLRSLPLARRARSGRR